ncbi:hypothetical protein LS70_009655, partial [Helicobacter sp. MIT 11-5569]|uniref:hypothetical protein n=1 Tax=Helicobacter sp. MIT 11-5569 TaxID=1548151 RepID=UPI0010FEB8EF
MESKMQFQSITFEEYNKIRKLLLVGSEAIREEVYRDSRGIATIGIGINIGGNNLKGLWIKLILYYFFGLTKKLKDIPFTQFDDYKYTFNNIIKDTTSYKYEEYKTLIDNISAQMLKTLQTDIKTSTLNTIIQDNIKDYINETKKKQKQNPNSNLEQLQRLSEEDLKITKDSQRNNQYLEFKLNEQQAEELFNIMAINYEAITLKHFNNKDITHFNKIKEEKESNKEYYKEFIPFLSATYQAPNSIKNNTLIQKAFISKSRFLIWAVLRYDLGSDIRRRILQSAIFNFNAKLDNQIENDEEKFNTCIDIFKTLNLLEENTDTNKQTHLQYFREQELERKKREDGKAGNNMQEIMKSEVGFCKGKPNLESCKIYHSNVINPSELEPLMNLLNPYVKYLDSLIPSAKFENNADFNKFTLESDAQESTTQSDSNLYRFKPQNIYVLNNNNHHEVLNAMREYNATKDTSNENPNNTKEITKDSKDSNNTNKDSNNQTNKTENLLLIITEAIHEELKIQKPINTYLYIVQNKAICNTIDCALLNNPLRNSTKENDKCELYTYEEQENNKPNMNSLATTTSLQLQEKDNTLESKENNYTYSFDILNHLNIKQDHQTFFVLSNYRFYLEEMYNNININNNPNIYLGSTNTTNFNQDSTNSTYITQTILQPNIAYSTLGIQLKTSKPQDTFNNNGNFNIKLTNIDFKSIESITNHSITKDSPI